MPVLLMTSRGGASVRREPAQQIDDVLGVAEVGEIGLDGQHDLVGGEQRLLHPRRPHMRQIEDDGRNAALGDVDDLLEGRSRSKS